MAAHHPEAERKRAPLARESNSHSLVVYAELPAVNSVVSRRRLGMRRETADRELEGKRHLRISPRGVSPAAA